MYGHEIKICLVKDMSQFTGLLIRHHTQNNLTNFYLAKNKILIYHSTCDTQKKPHLPFHNYNHWHPRPLDLTVFPSFSREFELCQIQDNFVKQKTGASVCECMFNQHKINKFYKSLATTYSPRSLCLYHLYIIKPFQKKQNTKVQASVNHSALQATLN